MREVGYSRALDMDMDMDWERVFLRCKRLSEAQTVLSGARSLDILPMASAMRLRSGRLQMLLTSRLPMRGPC